MDEHEPNTEKHLSLHHPFVVEFIFGLIILAAALGADLMYIQLHSSRAPVGRRISPTPSVPAKPVVSWSRYRSSAYNMSFLYPSEWKVLVQGAGKQATILIGAYRAEGDFVSYMRLVVYDNPLLKTIPEYSRDLERENVSNDRVALITDTDVKVPMQFGVEAYYQPELYCGGLCQSYVWEYRGKIYQFLNYPHPEVPDEVTRFDQIVGTIAYSADEADTTDATIRTDIHAIQSALEMYYLDNFSTYPANLYQLVPDYLQKLPTHPVDGYVYQYARSEAGDDYTLSTFLKDGALYELNKP